MTSSRYCTFVALYRASGASDIRLVAVSEQADLVAHVVSAILAARPTPGCDPTVDPIDRARRRALGRIARELALPTAEDAVGG